MQRARKCQWWRNKSTSNHRWKNQLASELVLMPVPRTQSSLLSGTIHHEAEHCKGQSYYYFSHLLTLTSVPRDTCFCLLGTKSYRFSDNFIRKLTRLGWVKECKKKVHRCKSDFPLDFFCNTCINDIVDSRESIVFQWCGSGWKCGHVTYTCLPKCFSTRPKVNNTEAGRAIEAWCGLA